MNSTAASKRCLQPSVASTLKPYEDFTPLVRRKRHYNEMAHCGENTITPSRVGRSWARSKRKPRRGQEGALQDAPDPAGVPELTDAQLRLPEAVGHLFDRTILASDALRPLADAWCRHAKACLLRVGRIVRPLFVCECCQCMPLRSNHLPQVHLPVQSTRTGTPLPRRYRRSRTLIRLRL